MRIIDAILYQFRVISLTWWIIISIVAILLLVFRHKKAHLAGNLLIVYIVTIFASTVLSRDPVKDIVHLDLINLDLVNTWIERITGSFANRSELILNFCMLLPVGILFPLATKKNLMQTVMVGFALTVIIELLQFFTMRGWFELSDILDNTIGVIIGYALYHIGEAIYSKYTTYIQNNNQNC